MNRKLLCGGILASLLAASSTLAETAHPNVVVILADDLGYGDVQCYNAERGKIPTPHIDRLAAQGIRFTDGHSSSGVCSPSRYTLLTGRYHWRTKLQAGIVGVWGPPLIAPERLTIGRLAQQHGYRTACIGKWHLGREWPITPEQKPHFTGLGGKPGGGGQVSSEVTDAHRATWRTVFSQSIPHGPTTRGFDEYFGTDVPNWPPYCFIEGDRTVGIPSELLAVEKLRQNQASLQGPALPDWQLEPILPALGDRAVKFITTQVQAQQRFLLYLPLTAPHTPLAVNAEWRGTSGLNDYADFVRETDAVVGRVLAALEASGVADNTLVLFTADNGCAPYIGKAELERRGHFPSGPLRGAKADAWEGGHRVPFVVRWPRVVRPGRVCEQLVHHADLLRTLADIFGASLPDDAGEDSHSLLPLLKGEDRPVRAHAVSTSSAGVPAVRSGRWKYIAGPAKGSGATDDDPASSLQLYNLADDVAETQNLVSSHPEKVAEMQQLLEHLITDGRSTPGTRQANDVRVVRYPRVMAAGKRAVGRPRP